MKKLSIIALSTFAVLFFASGMTEAAFAADTDVICADVHPCNSDGTVMAPFNEGACAPKYMKECMGEQFNTEIAACEEDRDSMNQQLAKVKAKLVQANRKIRRLSRR